VNAAVRQEHGTGLGYGTRSIIDMSSRDSN